MTDHTQFRNATASSSPEELRQLAGHSDPVVRAAVAANEHTDPQTLEKLSNDTDPEVLATLKQRPLRIKGKTVSLRAALPSDASFILRLRLDESRNKFVSPVQNNLAKQVEYLEGYKERERAGTEYYFIIENFENTPVGKVRLYDFKGDSFCWGSWMTTPEAPANAALESALLVYDFAFGSLGFTRSHFEVRKGNDKVIAFHKRFGAQQVDEDEIEVRFNFTKEAYQVTRARYAKFAA